MVDTVETIAFRLGNFIQAVESKSRIPDFDNQIRDQPRRREPENPTLRTYRECLNKLKSEELAEFDRLIGKMFAVFNSPPGAIIPR